MVREKLGPLVRAVSDAKLVAVWICDPMHGNTEKSSRGVKTRHFEAILKEIEESFIVHQELGKSLSTSDSKSTQLGKRQAASCLEFISN